MASVDVGLSSSWRSTRVDRCERVVTSLAAREEKRNELADGSMEMGGANRVLVFGRARVDVLGRGGVD